LRWLAFLMLTGCTVDYSKDGSTTMSYCLFGSVIYVDDTTMVQKHVKEPILKGAQCEASTIPRD